MAEFFLSGEAGVRKAQHRAQLLKIHYFVGGDHHHA